VGPKWGQNQVHKEVTKSGKNRVKSGGQSEVKRWGQSESKVGQIGRQRGHICMTLFRPRAKNHQNHHLSGTFPHKGTCKHRWVLKTFFFQEMVIFDQF